MTSPLASNPFWSRAASLLVALLALCANPAAFGGCEGEDKTELLVRALSNDKKVLKALR